MMCNQATPKQPSYNFSSVIQIRFTDIDQLEHVTNSVYQQYYDIGRMEYFSHVLGEQMDWKKEGLVLVSLNMEYFKPIRLHDHIEVRTKTTQIGRKSIKMQQEIFNFTSNCVCSKSSSVMVACINLCSESIQIPERWVKKAQEFEHDLLLP